MQARPSTKLLLFLLTLKRSLAERRISLDQFLTEFKFLHPRGIARFEFARIVQRINEEGSNFDALILFSEMTHNGDILSKDNFKKWFLRMPSITVHKVVGSQSIQRAITAETAAPVNVRKEFIKEGMTALIKYINAKDGKPSQIFDDCDLDHSGEIDRLEFNKFLFACGLPEFKNRDNCRYMIDHIFDNYAGERMSKAEFFTIFKVKPTAVRKTVKQEQTQKKSKPSTLEPIENLQKSTILLSMDKQSPFVEKKVRASNVMKSNTIELRVEKEYNPEEKKVFANQQVIIQAKSNPIKPQPQNPQIPPSNAASKSGAYPLCKHTFRLGDPTPQMTPYADELERLLAAKKTYEDPKNPTSGNGVYMHAWQIFNGPLQLIQMSNQDLNKERKHLALNHYIEPNDINQGETGDCYFLCGLGAIVNKYPELISDLFFFDANYANYYCIKLFIDGEWKIIKTDQRFPSNGDTPCYTRPQSNELWTMLLEKAFAKVYGSYQAIDGGNTEEAFMVLTGAPIIRHDMNIEKDMEKLKTTLKGYDKIGYTMTTSSGEGMKSMNQGRQQEIGLMAGHGYSILGIYEILGETVVKMRNPWGHFQWHGQWSFYDKRWTPQLREKYDADGKEDDGVFFLGWEHFSSLFGQIEVCKINPTFVHTSLRMINNKRKSNYIQMKVTKKGKYHLFICQQTSRKYAGQEYRHSEARLIVVKKSDDEPMLFIGAKSTGVTQTCEIEADLEPGTYLISAKVKWSNGWTDHECFFTVYGADKVTLEKVNRSIAAQFKEEMMDSYCTINDGKGTMSTLDDYNIPDVTVQVYLSPEQGLGFTKITNNNEENTVQIDKTFTLSGMKIIKPKENPYCYYLGPNEYDVVGHMLSRATMSYTASQEVSIV